MSIMNESREDNNSPLKKLEQALQQAAAGGKSKKDADFREAYPLIVQHLTNKVPQTLVLKKFNDAYGYTLHPPGFRKMLTAERNRRDETGDVVVCTACGQQLPSDEKDEKEAQEQEGRNHDE